MATISLKDMRLVAGASNAEKEIPTTCMKSTDSNAPDIPTYGIDPADSNAPDIPTYCVDPHPHTGNTPAIPTYGADPPANNAPQIPTYGGQNVDSTSEGDYQLPNDDAAEVYVPTVETRVAHRHATSSQDTAVNRYVCNM